MNFEHDLHVTHLISLSFEFAFCVTVDQFHYVGRYTSEINAYTHHGTRFTYWQLLKQAHA